MFPSADIVLERQNQNLQTMQWAGQSESVKVEYDFDIMWDN